MEIQAMALQRCLAPDHDPNQKRQTSPHVYIESSNRHDSKNVASLVLVFYSLEHRIILSVINSSGR